MTEQGGGASAPPQPRDARGRFVRQECSPEELLQRFLDRGRVQFADPFLKEGVFTMTLGRSMKGYPVRLFHSHYRGGAWHRCPGTFDEYQNHLSPYGWQLAISPMTHYGWPGDKWEGEWTVEGMASLLIHLALSVQLGHLGCGDRVHSGGRRRSR